MAMILGVGHDVVDVADFADRLAMPGTAMRRLFSPRELRQAQVRGSAAGDGEAIHLAARWAAKEAVVKAWCAALGEWDAPYGPDGVPWSGIGMVDDLRGVPRIELDAAVREVLGVSLGVDVDRLRWHVSVSHDGPVASAVVVLEER